MTTNNTSLMSTHKDAIAALGFVHEHLPTSSNNNGVWFCPADQFGVQQVNLRVAIDDDSTEIHAFSGFECIWSARFAPETPANVINQAVAAAL